MANVGIRRYTGDEAGNIFLGQTGFDTIVSALTSTVGVAGDAEQWVAIKAIGASTVRGFSSIGEHLTDDGTLTGGVINLSDGDVVYGSFYKVTWGSGILLAYRG